MYAIYGNIYHQYIPVMLAYIPAPWIRHGHMDLDLNRIQAEKFGHLRKNPVIPTIVPLRS